MNVSILSHGFVGWGGGVDFVRFVASAIACISADEMQSKRIIIPSNDARLKIIRLAYHPLKTALKQIENGERPTWEIRASQPKEFYKTAFADLATQFEIVHSGSSYHAQLSKAVKAGSDIVLPCIVPPKKNFPLAWIGYLPDFQHLHLPHFFSEQEIMERNKNFRHMLDTASHIIVNANAVKNDIMQFHADHKAEIHVLPFSPCPQAAWLNDDLDVRAQYEINKPYFIICNQFWKHKEHATAFKAFAEYLQQGGEALLVCTGATDDYRFPKYFPELQHLIQQLNLASHIRILGHIPKTEQISLVKHALAVVQPTLCEGGPGGGASYDAIALGVPLIASDISVNFEISCGDVTFFKAGDAISLTQKLHDRGLIAIERPSNDFLMNAGKERQRQCGEFILKVMEKACLKSN